MADPSYRRTNDSSGLEVEPSTAGASGDGDHGFGYHELERAALAFVLEDEAWPMFLEWIRATHVSDEAEAWLENGPDLKAVRNEWMRHSPDPIIRGFAQ